MKKLSVFIKLFLVMILVLTQSSDIFLVLAVTGDNIQSSENTVNQNLINDINHAKDLMNIDDNKAEELENLEVNESETEVIPDTDDSQVNESETEVTPDTDDSQVNESETEVTPDTDDSQVNESETEVTPDTDDSHMEESKESQELASKASNDIVIVQLWQYPGCRDSLHLVYDKPGGKKIDYISSYSFDDALYLDETDTYFKIYYSGNIGWVKKNDTVTCDNGTKNLLTAEPRSAVSTRELTSLINNDIEVNTFEVGETIKNQDLFDSQYDAESINSKNTLQYQTVKPAYSPSYYKRKGNNLQHCYASNTKVQGAQRTCTNIGRTPSYLKEGVMYYSYDGNYFYTDLAKIEVNGTNAVNEGNPYYNYYQYLPMRSKTNITSSEFDSYLASIGYTQQITNEDKAILGTEVGWDSNGKLTSVKWHCNYSNKVWYRGSSTSNLCISNNKSKLVGAYEQLKETEHYKGVNAIFEAVWAIHESAYGRSPISIFKNNLYGMDATDSNTFANAYQYASVSDGANAHVDAFINKYLYTKDYRYFGPHLGNKGSGINRWYASDPYWGEKIAGQYFLVDQYVGFKDYNYYSIGIIENNQGAVVKQSANASSNTLYEVKNQNYSNWISDYPVLITDESGSYYKIKTDTPIKNNTPQNSGQYIWDSTYGYIEKSKINVINHHSYTDPNSTGDLISHVDSVSLGNELIVNGWGFIENLNLKSIDSHQKYFILLDSDNREVLRVKGVNQLRVDVTNTFGNKKYNYDYSGFNFVISQNQLANLPTGNYTAFIQIETPNFTREIPINLGNREVSIKGLNLSYRNSLVSVKHSVSANIDNIISSNGNLALSGWALLNGVSAELNHSVLKEIILTDTRGTEIYRQRATNIVRKDVTNYFGGDINYDYSGFEVTIPQNILDNLNGEYNILMQVTKGNVYWTIPLEKNIQQITLNSLVGNNVLKSIQNQLKLYVTPYRIINNTDIISSNSSSLHLNGWAFIEGLSLSNKNITKKLILRQNNKDVLSIGLDNVLREDVTNVLGNGINYNYSGFNVNISSETISNLKSGEYDIIFRLDYGNKIVEKEINIGNYTGNINGSIITISSNKIFIQHTVNSHIDAISLTNQSLNIQGWGYINGKSVPNFQSIIKDLILVDSKGNEVYRKRVTNNIRKDVSAAFHNNYDYAGYHLDLSLSELANLSGKYSLLMQYTMGEVYVTIPLTKTIDILNTIYNNKAITLRSENNELKLIIS